MLENGFKSLFSSKPSFGYAGKFKVKTPYFDPEESDYEVTTEPEPEKVYPEWYLNPLTHDFRPLSGRFLGRRSTY